MVNKCALQETMFESFMIQYHWNKIIELSHTDEYKSLPVLEYVIKLFITVKGFAVTHKERDRLKQKKTSKMDTSRKVSKSVRGKLKTSMQ